MAVGALNSASYWSLPSSSCLLFVIPRKMNGSVAPSTYIGSPIAYNRSGGSRDNL